MEERRVAEPSTVLLDPTDPIRLTQQLVDIPSVSGDEATVANALEHLLRTRTCLEVLRDGDTLVARTHWGGDQRVILAGHLDTVPIAHNVPARREIRDGREVVVGRGSVDMKGGVAIMAHLAWVLAPASTSQHTDACQEGKACGGAVNPQIHGHSEAKRPPLDVTWVFYDHEEVSDQFSGLGRVLRNHPEWIQGDLAVLGEPTAGVIEGGCNGTLRVIATFHGRAAHSARSWVGDNAIHQMAPVIERIAAFGNPEVTVDGLAYKESLSVVKVQAGQANNTIPDQASMTLNYRFAPSTTPDQALKRVLEYFQGTTATLVTDDLAPGARPGLDTDLAQELVRVATPRGVEAAQVVKPKYGWTDVARFAGVGIPALNFGPGDPLLAHTVDEHAQTEQIAQCAQVLRTWLMR